MKHVDLRDPLIAHYLTIMFGLALLFISNQPIAHADTVQAETVQAHTVQDNTVQTHTVQANTVQVEWAEEPVFFTNGAF